MFAAPALLLKGGKVRKPWATTWLSVLISALLSVPLAAQAKSLRIENKRDVVYLPWFWRAIMMIIRAIPEKIFKRMNL